MEKNLDRRFELGLKESKRICAKSNHHSAIKMLPRKKREACFCLNALLRQCDEIVDNTKKQEKTKISELKEWAKQWEKAYNQGHSRDLVMHAASKIFHEYSIPYEYIESFIRENRQDITKKFYKNFEELRQFMYGVASTVGLMTSHILGFSNKKALDHAESLGYGMQLTNIIRDVWEDFKQRGRVYLPLDEMEQFNVTKKHIENKDLCEDFKKLLEFQARRSYKFYERAGRGIKYLDKKTRFSVKLAINSYQALLDKIRKNNFDVFHEKPRFSRADKFMILLHSFC